MSRYRSGLGDRESCGDGALGGDIESDGFRYSQALKGGTDSIRE